jgi:hypothetical protein
MLRAIADQIKTFDVLVNEPIPFPPPSTLNLCSKPLLYLSFVSWITAIYFDRFFGCITWLSPLSPDWAIYHLTKPFTLAGLFVVSPDWARSFGRSFALTPPAMLANPPLAHSRVWKDHWPMQLRRPKQVDEKRGLCTKYLTDLSCFIRSRKWREPNKRTL